MSDSSIGNTSTRASFGMPRIADDNANLILESCPKRVRVAFSGEFIADSTDARLLFERRHAPAYYFPREAVRQDLLIPTEKTYTCPRKGNARYWSIQVGERIAEDSVWNYPEPIAGCPPIGELVAFEWDQVDAWFEEDEEIYVHPRNPYTRIDALESSRHVLVKVGGTTIAESENPVALFETGHPVRYYLPKTDVRLDVLRPSQTVTRCPYKGIANRYWTVDAVGERMRDAAWSYDHPAAEAARIAGRVAFFSERVDVLVDGTLVDADDREA